MAPTAVQTLRSKALSRTDTPDPERQGRRNDSREGVQLLDQDGALSSRFEACLGHIFAKYIEPPFVAQPRGDGLMHPPENSYLTSGGLDKYATETNGQPFSQETKQELREMLDVDDKGRLTLEGFYQIYQLQTENDEEESWRDLSTHGFDRQLQFVPSRQEDSEEQRVPHSSSGPIATATIS